jgi:hypothetical protein
MGWYFEDFREGKCKFRRVYKYIELCWNHRANLRESGERWAGWVKFILE